MKKVFLMMTLGIGIISASCSKDPIFGDDPKGGGCFPEDPKTFACEAMMPEEAPAEKVTTAGGTNIMKAWIEGDNLKLEVGYSGCNKHTFDLHLTDDVIENTKAASSMVLQLADNNGEQFCQAYFQETLCFDISKLKVGSHGQVGISLQNHDNVNLVYTY